MQFKYSPQRRAGKEGLGISIDTAAHTAWAAEWQKMDGRMSVWIF